MPKVKSTMSSKRRSTSELNADNWQEEEEPEDAGNFIKAPADILKNRVFKSARRRVTAQPGETPKANAFSSFSGFNAAPVSSHSSLFSFLGNTTKPSTTSVTTTSNVTTPTMTNGSVPQTSLYNFMGNAKPALSSIAEEGSSNVSVTNIPTATSFSFLANTKPITKETSLSAPQAPSFSFMSDTIKPALASTPKDNQATQKPMFDISANISKIKDSSIVPQTSTFSFKPTVKSSESFVFKPTVKTSEKPATTSCSSSYASLLNFLANTKSSTAATTKTETTTVTKSLTTMTSTMVNSPTKIVRKSDTTESEKKKKVDISSREEKESSEDEVNLYTKLRSLNECLLDWIKKCIEDDPACILLPIFNDYQNYLKKILYFHNLIDEEDLKEGEEEEVEDEKEQDDKDIEVKVFDEEEEEEEEEEQKDSDEDDDDEDEEDDDEEEEDDEDKEEKNDDKDKTEVKKAPGFSFAEPSISKDKPVFVFGSQTSKPKESEEPAKAVFTFGAKSATSATEKLEPPKLSTSIFSQVNTSNIFSSITQTDIKNAFSNLEKNPFLSSNFGNNENQTAETSKTEDTPSSGIFSQGSTGSLNSNKFSFGSNSTNSFGSAGFSFGGKQPFTFGAGALKPPEKKPETNEEPEEENEEPPKPEDVTVSEDGAFFEQRCKVFVKKDDNYSDRGVGTLFLKSTPNDKTQLIVRATTTLQSLLLNTLLNKDMPIRRMNKTNVMVVCLPLPDSKPPPVPVLLRVKEEEDADKLLEALEKYRK